MKYFSILAFALMLSANVSASPPNTAYVPSPVLSSESTDFEYEGEGPGDAQGMVYNNGMYGGRDFYLGDYLGFNPAWVYPGTRVWGSFNPGFDAYRN